MIVNQVIKSKKLDRVVVGGKVPVVITSRSDEAQARLASIAAAVVALD